MSEQKNVAIIGAGLVGSGWALVFARAGYTVRIHDPSEAIRDGFMQWAEDSVPELAAEGLIDDGAGVLARLTVCEELQQAVSDAGYIQESVFETVETKTDVSLAIDAAMSPDAMVGSSSSGIPASRFTENCRNRTRFLIAHPVNPPHLVPVVELVPAPWTDPKVVTQTRAIMEDVGQVPVSLTREIDGFVLNRLQGALLNEAWALYEEGYATLEDIDATVAHGLGLRWAFMGPFETIDLNAPKGIVDYAERLGGMYYNMATQRSPKPWDPDSITRAGEVCRQTLPESDLASRRAWRDATLTRLARFKKDNGLSR
ncbi:3-hydroxyacyl-CoA dehydrogenase [Paracoccus aerodenitrificans]|uniref:3-hydroxyacyl-CoA dehydrogenase n=1 Tax=Paracoccus aerodenitrificans TaxID=3017781 RepID=UPI0022F11A1B|nr:3-hydroxyacyl-CoA dehydrogenase [Paracoccus aerodenitrificans]WBU63780.1 3-hydroxyacyl-CoA dehydrogenase [Paracoccus aerodenitrificans]